MPFSNSVRPPNCFRESCGEGFDKVESLWRMRGGPGREKGPCSSKVPSPLPGILFPNRSCKTTWLITYGRCWRPSGSPRQVTHHRVLPAREARYGETRRPWPRAIAGELRERGIASLYSHQALTADTVRAGRDVVVATPTASGKTLCSACRYWKNAYRTRTAGR